MGGAARHTQLSNLCNYLKLSLLNTTNLLAVASNINSKFLGTITFKADSGATKHFLKYVDRALLQHLIKLSNGPLAMLPDQRLIKPSHSGHLTLSPHLSSEATHALVYPGIHNESLISIGQLCDDGCIATFTKDTLKVCKGDHLILTGKRNTHDGLWDVTLSYPTNKSPLQKPSVPSLHYIVRKDQSKRELALYLYKCLNSPSFPTLDACIKRGNLISWPAIDDLNFKKLIGNTVEHAKGHLKQEKQGLQSTTPSSSPSTSAPLVMEDRFPTKISDKTYDVCTLILPSEKGITYSDQTGRFPYQSSQGNKYIMLAYNYDANALLVQTLKDKNAATMTTAWDCIYQRLTKNGHKTNLWLLDNEISAEFVGALENKNLTYQRCTPGMHRTNAAERGIQSFKDHFLSGLAGCHPNFPIREWDRLIPQTELTLNLLRNSRVNPSLSAWTYLFGNHDFNRVPLLPLGTKVVIHSKPDNRKSWDYRGMEGWYIGPSFHHYRNIKIFMPATHAERDTDTVDIIPHHLPLSTTSIDDHIKATSESLITLLLNKSPPIGPIIKQSTKQQLLDLARLLNIDKTSPSTLPSTSEGALSSAPPFEGDQTPNSPSSTITHPPTSEGELSTPTPLTTTTPVTTINPTTPSLPLHPGLYATPTSSPSSSVTGLRRSPRLQRFHNPFSGLNPIIDKNVEITDKTKFNKFLRSYIRNHRTQQVKPQSSKPSQKLPPARPHPLTVPHPKSTKTSIQSSQHPMFLRRRHQRPILGTSFRHLAAQHLINSLHTLPSLTTNHIYNDTGQRLNLDKLLLLNPARWQKATSNELGRLAAGTTNIAGNYVIKFVSKDSIPVGKKVTYANFVCDYRPNKDDPWRVRLTVGGDKLDYFGNPASPAASLLESKLLINSVISDAHKGARFASLDLKDHFLQSEMTPPEYMKIHRKYFFDDIKKQYNIDSLIHHDEYVYCQINKGMYGLKQAAKLGRDKIIQTLQPFGYFPDKHSPNIWRHTSRPTVFCLCVDDFGIKYFSKSDLDHLVDALRTTYELKVNYDGTQYCGLNFKWNYDKHYVDVSMPKFVMDTLTKLQHTPSKIQHAPHSHPLPLYGRQQQFTPPPDSSPLLSPDKIKYVQSVVGSFLYYGRAVDPTILTALNEIGLSQSKPTVNTQLKIQQLMDYLHTYPSATLRYKASDMVLHIDSDAAYLVAPGAKSRIAGYYYLSNNYQPTSTSITPTPLLNAPVHVECKILRHVVSSSAEAETGGLYANCLFAIQIRHMLNALGHPQPPTPIKTDNKTAAAFANNTLKQRRSKSWDMRYFWLLDRMSQSQFLFIGIKGAIIMPIIGLNIGHQFIIKQSEIDIF